MTRLGFWPAAAIATSLIAWNIDRNSVWFAESASIMFARLPLNALYAQLRHVDASFALYYTLLHFWMRAAHSTVGIRLLSAIFALAALGFTYLATARFASRRRAAIACVILAVIPAFTGYAIEARAYSLAICACAAVLWTMGEYMTSSRRTWLLPMFFAMTVALYAEPFTFAFLAVAAGALPVIWRNRRAMLAPAGVLTLALIAYLPVLRLVLAQGPRQISWMLPPSWSQADTFVWAALGGVAWGWPAAATIASLTAYTIAVSRGEERRTMVWLAACMVIPVVAVVAASWIKPMLAGRYVATAMLPAAICCGAAVDHLLFRGRTFAIIVAALAAFAVLNLAAYAPYPNEHYRQAVSYLNFHAPPGDPIVVYGSYVANPVAYAFSEGGKSPANVLYVRRYLWGKLAYTGALFTPAQRTWMRSHPRVWLIRLKARGPTDVQLEFLDSRATLKRIPIDRQLEIDEYLMHS